MNYYYYYYFIILLLLLSLLLLRSLPVGNKLKSDYIFITCK
jgi:hypothetical protein